MERIYVYRNLHYRNQVIWSLRSCKTGLVVAHEPRVYLSMPKFCVGSKGNQKVRREGRKNVHAGVRGVQLKNKPRNVNWKKAYYNPYKVDTFVDENGNPLFEARYAMLNSEGLWYGA